jgi:hypothetical protein
MTAGAAARTETVERRARALVAEQRLLVRSLLRLREQLPGSLFTRWGRCGKAGCACADEKGHGPYYVLSTRSGGAGGFAYLSAPQAAEAKTLVAAHRRFRDGLRRLHGLNQELLTLLGRHQETVSRRTRRRLGLAMPGKAV